MTDPLQDEWNHLVRENRKAPSPPPPPAGPAPEPSDKRRIKWGLPTLLFLSVVALALHLQGALFAPPAQPTPEEIKAGHKASLALAAKAIHDYATFHGNYPHTVSEVMPLTLDIDYRTTPDGFELRMTDLDGTPIVIRGK